MTYKPFPASAIDFHNGFGYALPVNDPVLSLDHVSRAIPDQFGQDGGRLLLEKLRPNLEEIAESPVLPAHGIEYFQEIEENPLAEKDFNIQVSEIFSKLISEMMGEDVYT